jgi:hypothetical protein
MSRLPGWDKPWLRLWYAYAVVVAFSLIAVLPGKSSSGEFLGAGEFLVILAVIVGLVSRSIWVRYDKAHFKTIRVQTGYHNPEVRWDTIRGAISPLMDYVGYWGYCPTCRTSSAVTSDRSTAEHWRDEHARTAGWRYEKVPRDPDDSD